MTFFSRPNLDIVQFKQLSGSTLTLSGITDFVGTLKSKGIEIDGSSGVTGSVLTYIGGKIQLYPSGAGSTPVFNTNRITTRSGIPAVNTGTGCTVQCFLENYFFPPVPLSTSISIASGGVCREFGDYNCGNLCWNVVRNTYPICAISASTDGSGIYEYCILTNGCVGTTGCTMPYSYAYCNADPSLSGTNPAASACTSTSVSFKICAISCFNEISTGSTSISWQNKKFYFNSNMHYYAGSCSGINNAITGASNQQLTTSKTLNICQNICDNFFYYAYPKVFGTPTFVVNGLTNNAWGNPNTGTLFTITFANVNGYRNQYYVARSDNKITGVYNIIVS